MSIREQYSFLRLDLSPEMVKNKGRDFFFQVLRLLSLVYTLLKQLLAPNTTNKIIPHQIYNGDTSSRRLKNTNAHSPSISDPDWDRGSDA